MVLKCIIVMQKFRIGQREDGIGVPCSLGILIIRCFFIY